MFRSQNCFASLVALTAALTLSLSGSEVEAGGCSKGGGGFRPPVVTLPVHPPTIRPIGFPIHRPICPPTVRPIHPPIVCPPPVLKPICPPVIRPICPPPVVRPICPPPVVCPPTPPVICPPPVVCPPTPPVVCPPPVIKPICYKPIAPPVVCPPTCTCHQCTCDDWYFGMSLQVVQTSLGIGLQVHDVTHGSPASQAGLEVGDILVMAAGQTFETVQTNEQGVALLQSLATATDANLNLVVQDSRTSLIASVNITPQSQAAPAPAITTAMAF